MSRQAGKVDYYFSHFHLANDSWHIPPQITIIQFVAGKGHLERTRKETEKDKMTHPLFVCVYFHSLKKALHIRSKLVSSQHENVERASHNNDIKRK